MVSSAADLFIREHETEPNTAFVLMPLAKDLQQIYEFVLKKWAATVGLEIRRADEIYGANPIMKDVWRNIQTAEIVIADLTGRNPNVMYELGLCHALWKKMILITQDIKDVPFDLKSFRLIPYDPSIAGAERLAQELSRTLDALRDQVRPEALIVPYEQTTSREYPRADGTVRSVSQDKVSIRLSDGRVATMIQNNYSWTERVRDLSHKFRVGSVARGVLLKEGASPEFSVKHQWPDPWPTLIDRYSSGTIVSGDVVGTSRSGVFVRLEDRPRLNAFVPDTRVGRGDRLRIRIERIDRDRKNVTASVVDVVSTSQVGPSPAKFAVGDIVDGLVDRGVDSFVVVELDGGPDKGICHVNSFPEFIDSLVGLHPVGSEGRWCIIGHDERKGRYQLSPASE